MRLAKKQEHVTNTKGENESIETDFKKKQMSYLTET